MLPASEDLMGNMRTRFLRGLFTWHDTGQSLLEEGIFLVAAVEGVAKEPPFLRGRGHYVCVSTVCLLRVHLRWEAKPPLIMEILKSDLVFSILLWRRQAEREVCNRKPAEHCSEPQTLLKEQ